MTHTLELPENVERVLECRARRRGVPLETLLLDLAAREAATKESAEAARSGEAWTWQVRPLWRNARRTTARKR